MVSRRRVLCIVDSCLPASFLFWWHVLGGRPSDRFGCFLVDDLVYDVLRFPKLK